MSLAGDKEIEDEDEENPRGQLEVLISNPAALVGDISGGESSCLIKEGIQGDDEVDAIEKQGICSFASAIEEELPPKESGHDSAFTSILLRS